MAVQITQEEYSVPWQGVTYEAVFYGYRYPCLVASHHLQMKVGKEAWRSSGLALPKLSARQR